MYRQVVIGFILRSSKVIRFISFFLQFSLNPICFYFIFYPVSYQIFIFIVKLWDIKSIYADKYNVTDNSEPVYIGIKVKYYNRIVVFIV